MGWTTRARLVAIVGAVGAALSCSGDAAGPSDRRVAAVRVEPATSSIALGATLPLQATVLDADGNILSGRRIFFASNDERIVSVSVRGVVTANALGSAQIAASSEGQSALAVVTVTQTPVATVAVVPGSAQTTVGGTVQLDAATYDASGNLLAGRGVLWSSSNTAVATADAQGLVRGHGFGSATISATAEGKSGSSSVSVTLVPVGSVSVSPSSASLTPGQQTQLTAVTLDAGGNALVGRAVTWESGATSVATVSQTGLVSAQSAGSAVVTATSEGTSATALITVTSVTPPPPPPPPPTIARVRISPDEWDTKLGRTLQFTAKAYDSSNREIPNVTFTWSSNDTRRVTVTQTGFAIAISKGDARITVAAGNRTDSADVEIDD